MRLLPNEHPWCADVQIRRATARSLLGQEIQTGHIFMNLIIWLVVGGLIGWAASVAMRTREGVLLNVVVGIFGAALGGWLLSPLVGVSTINQRNFSVPSLLVSFLGALVLLVIVTLVTRRTPRWY
jgi:uncharacterized membrane protein YeaQ/YmgE (transglycosylase-associated protein family)